MSPGDIHMFRLQYMSTTLAIGVRNRERVELAHLARTDREKAVPLQ